MFEIHMGNSTCAERVLRLAPPFPPARLRLAAWDPV